MFPTLPTLVAFAIWHSSLPQSDLIYSTVHVRSLLYCVGFLLLKLWVGPEMPSLKPDKEDVLEYDIPGYDLRL